MLDRWHIVAVLEPAAMRRQQKWDESRTAKEFKVTKLPRNGPKDGQSVELWQHGKTKGGDAAWEKRRADAISKGKL
jgi:hypothetical protein